MTLNGNICCIVKSHRAEALQNLTRLLCFGYLFIIFRFPHVVRKCNRAINLTKRCLFAFH